MDLYDDLDTKQRAGQIDGWSSGIKLLQSQLALKKTAVPPQTRKDHVKRSTVNKKNKSDVFMLFSIHFSLIDSCTCYAIKIKKRK